MPQVKYNVKGVEPGIDFDTPIPVDVYLAKVSECVLGTSKSSGNEMITVTLEIIKGEWKGRKLWDYITLTDASAWKMRQFLEAVGIVKDGKEQGDFNTEKVVGTKVMVRVRHQTDEEFGTRAKVGSVSAVPDSAVDDDEEPEEEPEEEPQAEDLTYADVMEADRDELEEIVEENELEIRVTKRTTDDKLKERIIEELELEAPDEEEEDEKPDYKSWSQADLKAELKSRDLSPAGTKATLVRKLEKDDEDNGDGSEPF